MNSIAARLLSALTYPRDPSDFVELASPLRTTRELRAKVLDVRRETHDVATLVLRVPPRFRPHRAGQHVLLGAEIDGVRRTRCFSIASGEGARGTIELTIKAHAGGSVTPRLVSGELRSRYVTLSQPAGDFTLPDVLPRRLLFVSGGSGITPVMSMLRTLAARGPGPELVFLTWARSKADVIFGEELATLAHRARIQVRTSLFDEEQLARDLPDFASWDTFACGPPAFLGLVSRAFERRNALARVRFERFSLPTTTDAVATDGEVAFVRSKRRAKGGGPLLVLAEGAGLTPPSGCRMGLCKTCTCRKVSGVTRDLRTGELSTDDDVDIQLCVSAPVGNVALDL